MDIKDKIRHMLNIHTRVVTGVFFFNCFYLFWLPGDASIRIIDILGIQVIGLISALAYLPFSVEKEYSKVAMVILNFVHFLIINATVFAMGLWLGWFSFKYKGSVIAIELMVIAVYAITTIISYTIDCNDAAKLNKKLQERNKGE